MKSTAFFLLLLCLAVRGLAAEPSKHVQKTSHKPCDIGTEVVTFVSHLIETDPDVHNDYTRLIADTKEEADGRFVAGTFLAIQWLVPNFENDFRATAGTRDGEYVYLVQQQIKVGFHHGYSVKDNIVARVKVKLHEDYTPDRKARGGFRLTSSSIDLIFDGFFSVTLDPK